MNIGKVIQLIRDEKDITQKELADTINISYSVMNRIESGERPARDEEIIKIAKALGVTSDYLLGLSLGVKSNKVVTTKSIPVLGNIAAGIPISAITDIVDYEEIDYNNGSEYIGLKVKGNSMHPRIQNGDVVIIKLQPSVDSGDIAAILINGDDATLKKVIKDENGIQLISFNQEMYAPRFFSNEQIEDLPVKIIGKVVEFRGKF